MIAYRNGAPVRLKDVADVVDGPEDLFNLGLANGKAAIVVRVTKSPGANVITTVNTIKAVLPKLRAELGPSIDLNVAVDSTTSIKASLAEVERTLLIAVILVVAVVLVFLRNGKATLIPGVAVVVSLLGTLAAMYLLHFTLDNLSLMSLTVATGFVVDDAIVVLENITRHVENGMGRFEAALLGAKEVSFTVVSMSISLIAVFLPILAMGGLVGRLFREFAMTLSASILISLLLSLTATPAMAARLIDDHQGGPKPRDTTWRKFWGRTADTFESGFDRLLKTYEGSLAWALDNSRLVLFMLITTVCLTVFLYIKVPKGFFPQEDTGTLIGGVQVDQASSFALTAAKFRKLQAIVMHDPAVATATSFTQSAGGFMFISLKPRDKRPHVTGDMVIGRLTPKLARVAGAQLFLQSAQDLQVGGRQSNAQYQYTLQSDDLNALRTWSNKLLEQLKTYPDLTQVNTDQQSNALESYITVDRKTASRLGITSQQVDSTLADAFGQSFASIIYNPLNQYHVVMEIAQKYQGDPTALKSIYVTPASGSSTSTSSTSLTRASTTSSGAGGGVRTSTSSAGGVGTTSGASAVGGGSTTTLGSTSSVSGSTLTVGSAAGVSGTFASGGTGATSSSAVGLGSNTSGSSGSNLVTNSAAGGSTSTASTGGNLATAGLASNSQAQSSSSTASQNASAVGGGSSGSSTATSGTSGAGSSGGALSGAGVQRSTTGGAVATSSGVAISTSRETMIPLSAVATWALQNTPLAVNHQGQSVAATLSFNLAPGKSLSDAQRDVANAVQVIGMPGNVIGSFQGTAQVYQQSLANEPILIAAALVAVYIVLGVLYESYIHPLTVLSTLPSAGVGAVLAMMIFGVDFSIISLIGVVLLIGIVKKNAIMIIDFALVAEREQGLSSRDAIYQACVLRFRPILMTTCAAILGALPLALGLGEGGELRQPLGISIIGGLIASQVLTLLTTPVVYLYLDRLNNRAPRLRPLPRGLRSSGGAAPMPAE